MTPIVLHDEETKRRSEKARPVYVNPEQVAWVQERKTYTTLIVSGKYLHVTESLQEVLDALGWSTE